MKQKSRR